MQKFITVEGLTTKFNYDVLNKDVANLENKIQKPAINRLGLEIANETVFEKEQRGIIGWGTNESKYLRSLSEEKQDSILKKITSLKMPMIILSIGFDTKLVWKLLKWANKLKIPVVKTKLHLSEIHVTLGAYLSNFFAKEQTVHGSLMVINGIGTMIIGPSGIGKSETILELLGHKNHLFVSDDSVVIKRIGDDFVGSPSKITKGFLEVRGIGLINVPFIYGLKSMKNSAKIDMCIELVHQEQANKLDRLGNLNLAFRIMDSSVPKIQIPVQTGRSLGALIETAVNVFIAKKENYEPLEIIKKRSLKSFT